MDVVEGEFAGLNEMGHDGLGAAAEEIQEVVDEAALGLGPRDGGFEDVGIADAFGDARGFLLFEPVDGGLDGGVGRAILLGEGFLDFADGAGPAGPEGSP